jgi:uncharacterized protein (DUF2267 family)
MRADLPQANYATLVRAVAVEGRISLETAERYIVAVIATLEARLSFTDVADLEAEFPQILREILQSEPILDLPEMDAQELLARIHARLGVSQDDAAVIARIVFAALRGGISAMEAARVEAQLPPGIRALWRAEGAQLRTGAAHM